MNGLRMFLGTFIIPEEGIMDFLSDLCRACGSE